MRLAEYALYKCLPEQFLRDVGMGDISYMGKPPVRIPYLHVGRIGEGGAVPHGSAAWFDRQSVPLAIGR